MEQLELGCSESIDDPVGYFGRWFDRGDVHPHADPRGFAIIGHAAVADAFKDAETLSADRVSVLERVAARHGEEFRLVVELLSGWTIFRDPPVHTRLRKPVQSAFTHRRVTALEGMVEEIFERAFDDMEAHAVDGVGDLTGRVSKPVPAQVIGALLGVDDSDRHLLQDWSDELAAIVFTVRPSETPPEGVVRAARAFHDFFGRLVDGARGDESTLLGRIAALDTTFSRTELVGLCTMLLFAGHETTTSFIQHLTALLMEQPDLAEELRDDDVDVEVAVDELLRRYGPARAMIRKVAVPHERGGVALPAGATMILSIASANHDPRVFDDPDRLDLTRSPNQQLSFGWGLHHCLGAQLARVEAATYLRVLLRRYPEIRPVGEVPPLVGAVMGATRGPVELAVDRR